MLALLGLLAGGCSDGRDQSEVHGTLERDRLELVAESHERIIGISVREGDRVAGGAELLRQEAGTMQPRLDQASASLAEAVRRLADLVKGPREREIGEARAALAGAESSLETERREFARVQSLVERKLLSASSLDQARARRDAAQSARDRRERASDCCSRAPAWSRSVRPRPPSTVPARRSRSSRRAPPCTS
jgi:multidrug resistance efflux pump